MQQLQQAQRPKKLQKEQILLPVGSVIRNVNGDRYIVEGLLGTGVAGAVYRVRDGHKRENVFAVKELIDPNGAERERFMFEAEVLMRLDHEALPSVYRVFENEKLKRVYILMDYIEGRDLEVLQKEQPNECFSLPLVLALLTPVVSALTYLHRREPPIVHRDIKPANIVVPIKGGDAMLVDFGIAKEYIYGTATTALGQGSPGYAALEQYSGGTNIRTDVYGLGATIYTLLTGVVPIVSVERVTGSKGTDPLKPVHALVPDLPQGVSDAISRAMSVSRDDRFATIDEFWEELNAQTQNERQTTESSMKPERRTPRVRKDVAPLPILEQRRLARKKRRQTVFFAGIGGLLAVLLLAMGIATYVSHMSQQRVRATRSVATATVPTAVPTVDQSPYPTLATSYKGTMGDVVNNTTTSAAITQLQQNKRTIRGFCNGLGLTGPFDGTISEGGHIVFTVKIPDGDTGILFEGDVKTGGNMAGEFYIISQKTGQRTGEYGTWSLTKATQ